MSASARKVIAAAFLLIVAGAAIVGYVLFAPRGASPLGPGAGARVRDYVGRQIVSIVNVHLVPQLAFDTVDYEAPGTVRLSGVTLTAPDGTRVLDVDRLVVTLAEPPLLDRPIKIARVEIEGGEVRIVQDPVTGSILGLRPLARTRTRDELGRVPEQQNLRSVLVLEQIEISDVGLVYDDGSGSPMVLEGLACSMDVKPDERGAGWYALNLRAGRSPGLSVDLRGSFDIDCFVLDLGESEARVTLDERTIGSLPPQIQGPLRDLEASGDARFTFSGQVPLESPLTSALDGRLDLRAFSVSVSDYRVPIDRCRAEVRLEGARLTIENLLAETLGGEVSARADAELSQTGRPLRVDAVARGIELREALRAATPPDQLPTLAGVTRGEVRATMLLADPLGTIDGSGEVHVREGRLLVLPGLGELVQTIGNMSFSSDTSYGHEADVLFRLEPAGIRITESSVVTGIIAADATGVVGYDGSLDLSVRAGPLKKLAGLLGQVGRAVGNITERLVSYRIGGTVSEPTVSVRPLGIGD